ncbi:MAG: type II secretion system protein GspG, partial [Chromatiaceae bacterium]
MRSRSRRRGFTLVELLVVLAILGLLVGLVGPQVMKALGGSKTKTARIQIEDLSATLDIYRLELGRYPTTNDGLQALVENT